MFQGIETGFDELKSGAMPRGWQSGFFGVWGSPHWYVVSDPTAPSAPHVLRQDGVATYSWLVAPSFTATSATIQVRFKLKAGKEDPEAGIVARFLDAKNYYYVRASTRESDVVFYRMVDGRNEVVKQVDIKVAIGQWHKLRIESEDDAFKVFYDGKKIMSLKDVKLKGRGRVGVWTTADTVVDFDDFVAWGT